MTVPALVVRDSSPPGRALSSATRAGTSSPSSDEPVLRTGTAPRVRSRSEPGTASVRRRRLYRCVVGSAELVSATACGLARLIAVREVSAREVVDAHLRRVEDVNGAINAVVQVDAERALMRADQADAALARGERWGALHGVPFTVKDNIAAAGIPMAIGVPERAGMAAAMDATAVCRLKAAGGILLAKTNCPPWGDGIETDNELYGRTSNPYDLTRTPGGSSGGEAAIIAAQGSPCGLGTDSGASVRRRHRGARGASRGRTRAHDRDLALVRRRRRPRWTLAPAAPLGRLPKRDARVRGPLRPHPLSRVRRSGSRARHDERRGTDRPHQLHDAAQPHRLAGGHGPLWDVARGAPDRRPARRAAVAR
jgi:amidase